MADENFLYNPHTQKQRESLLRSIGITDVEALYKEIPTSIRLGRDLSLSEPTTEWELESKIRTLADKNMSIYQHTCFAGSSIYDHYISSVIDVIASRGEYLTAYTAYQPEMSQGLLQILFEFQKLVSNLVGLPIVNNSVYDGATALAESIWMARQATDRSKVVMSASLWQQYREVCETYLNGRNVEYEILASDENDSGLTDVEQLEKSLKRGGICAYVVQTPNCWGLIEDVRKIAEITQKHGALLIVSTYPIALGLLEPAGHLGADIVSFEGQSLGIPLSSGGPYLGVVCCQKHLEKFLPGRIVGELTDLKGELAYALIKEDREQHIAREKATSHICSNQTINTIRATIFMALYGKNGFRDLAIINAHRAHQFAGLLDQTKIKRAKVGPFFNEMSLYLPKLAPDKARQFFFDHQLTVGEIRPFKSGTSLNIAITEKRTLKECERFIHSIDHLA